MTAGPAFGRPAATLTADTGLPIGDVAAGDRLPVRVAVAPHHPSTVVELQVDDGDGRSRSLRADRVGTTASHTVHLAELPPLDDGDRCRYRVVARRSGAEVGSLPADGSWLTVRGQTPPAPGDPAPPPDTARSAAALPPAVPRWAYDLTFFAALTVDLRAEVLGETPDGYRINFFVRDGWVRGPRIEARVRPEGGDWMCIRPDGIGEVDITITYETSDGALIMERAGGVFDLGPDGYDKVRRGDFTGAPPFYATPSWVTSHPSWTWLNRCQGFGIGRVVLDQLQVRCDIYLPTVGGARAAEAGRA